MARKYVCQIGMDLISKYHGSLRNRLIQEPTELHVFPNRHSMLEYLCPLANEPKDQPTRRDNNKRE